MSVATSLESRFAAASSVRVRQLDGESIVLDLHTNYFYSLDAIGSRMWTAIVGGGTLRDVRDALLADFDVAPQRLETDLFAFADKLQRLGLLELAGD